jgi:lipoprotein-anchoring transpeptidase ErfK/SrfK
MARLTPEEELRRRRRAERMRRERMRARRQRAVLVLALVVLASCGAPFALRPPAPPLKAVARLGDPATSVELVPKVKASAAAEVRRVAAEAAKPKPLVPAPGVKTIVVDKSDQTVTLYKPDGKPLATFRCASGVTYPRVGEYEVYGHDEQSWGLEDASTFYYFTKFERSDKGNNIGFHSIPQNPDGSLVGTLGVPVSHGCVRLAKDKAAFVFEWAGVGTKVIVRA